MIRRPILNVLVPLVILFALITAGAGVFLRDGGSPFPFTTLHGQTIQMHGQGIYQYESYFKAPINQGTDAVAMFVSLPLLVVSFLLYRRGSFSGGLLMIGALTFFLYYGSSVALGAAFNSLFLVYTLLFSASFFAFLYAITAVKLPELSARVSPGVPRRGISIFMFVAGLAPLFIWLSDIIGPLLQGQAPQTLESYTTMFTHALDIAIITPAAILTGVYLLQRHTVGYLLAVPMLILCTLIGIVVVGQTVMQTLAGITFPIGVYIGMIGSWVILGIFAISLTISFFRHLSLEAHPLPAVS
jgi:hypothetical protein